jgi:hypothetical protein
VVKKYGFTIKGDNATEFDITTKGCQGSLMTEILMMLTPIFTDNTLCLVIVHHTMLCHSAPHHALPYYTLP